MDKTNIANLPTEEKFTETKAIEIDGMTCANCVRIVEKTLSAIGGVSEVKVDLAQRIARVKFDRRKTNMPALHDALLQHGYRPTPVAEPVSSRD